LKNYVRDAEKDKKPELTKLWRTIKGRRTKTLENAAQRARKSSKEKQTRVGTIQKALRCALSLYPQQVLHPSTEADISTLN
jgi:hypothetical protein